MAGSNPSRAHLPPLLLLLLRLALLRLTAAGGDVTAAAREGSLVELSSRAHSQVVTMRALSGQFNQKPHAFIIVPPHV